jgi:hypothetical protein
MQAARLASLLLTMLLSTCSWAHGGGLDANGCHTNRKTGDYHCHGGTTKISTTSGAPSPAATGNQPARLVPSAPKDAAPTQQALPPGCYVGPRGGTYTITKSGRKNYSGC